MSKKPVFHDPSNRREPILKRLIVIFGSAALLLVAIFVASIFLRPVLPLPSYFSELTTARLLHPGKHIIHQEKKQLMGTGEPSEISKNFWFLGSPEKWWNSREKRAPEWGVAEATVNEEAEFWTWSSHFAEIPGEVRTSTGKITDAINMSAFFVEWDDSSFASLQDNIDKIDTLVSEELSISDTGVTLLYPDKFKRTNQYVESTRPSLRFIPLINNYDSEKELWNSDKLHNVLSDETRRKTLEDDLMSFIEKNSLDGLSIDFEDLQEKTFLFYYQFLSEMGTRLHADKLTLQVNVPLHNDAFDYPRIAGAVDNMVVMAYDEHWSSATPGPISSLSWYRDGISEILKTVPKDKVTIAVGNYGYDWSKGKKSATALTFQDANTLLRQSESELDFDSESLNPNFGYTDENNIDHEVWFLDAATAYDQISTATELGEDNISLWRLGSEDPSFWKLFSGKHFEDNQKPTELERFDAGYAIEYTGIGELYKVTRSPSEWVRDITFSDDLVTDEKWTTLPLPYEITRYGGGAKKKVAITFDDGPDATYTPQILDILKKYHATATFFVIGSSAEKYPDIVKRAYDEGSLIGNHTFSHPDISKISETRAGLELSITERLIESITGHSSILFRPPYGEDVEPEYPSQIAPLLNSNAMGYITVGMKLDPNDWAKPGVDAIIERTLAQADDERGNILLLHDGGWDRSETIAALPRLIESLRSHGYEIVSLSNLTGLPSNALMPVATWADRSFTFWDSVSFALVYFLSWGVYYIFVLGLAIGIFRLLVMIAFALIQRLRPERSFDPDYCPSVSVIVPAYNEEKVIVRTIESLLQNTYEHFDIIVVDDGSKDTTYETARQAFPDHTRVRVVTKENGGKGEAINHGIRLSESEIIIVIDADTLFDRDTIGLLARHFHDDRVAAVSGNVKVGNRHNLLTKMQALEYVTTQNLDRRAYDVLNTITVVPGAVGAWRRSVVLKAGGFTADTLAEDSDLTIAILRLGYRITHEDDAHAYTEAPDDWRSFAKQRFRWAFGILQVTYKHSRLMIERQASPSLRYFILPQMLVYQTIFPLIAPLIDLVAIGSILFSLVSYLLYGSLTSIDTTVHIVAYAFLFLMIETLVGILAFSFERWEDWRLLFLFPLQRIIYRFFMYYIQSRAIWWALTGRLMGWNKLQRTNTAKIL